jgi:thioesterase domain-containing protein
MGYYKNLEIELQHITDQELYQTPPKPAREHVALQTRRRDHRPKGKSPVCLIGWSLIGLAIATGVAVWLVAL